MMMRTQMILMIIIKINNDDDANEVKLIESEGAGLIR